MNRRVHVITDLQFGSTGKGLFAGYLAQNLCPDTVMCAWGPNSGHTFVDSDGTKYVHTMIPNGIVSPGLRRLMIGPGAVIDPANMAAEFGRCGHLMQYGKVFAIHEAAAVVDSRHVQAEQTYGRLIGSTMKGTGAAVAEKITRATPDRPIIARDALKGTMLEQYVVSPVVWEELLADAKEVLIEGSQGFSLSINQGFYPHITSRECTTHQILSDCAMPADFHFHGYNELVVYGVARTYPIRVANRYDEDGKMIGTSGPGYEDQEEIQWSSIDREPELTTVTKLPRRLFTFSQEQVRQAIRMNGVDRVFLNFANYCYSPDRLDGIIRAIEDYAPVEWLGYGPKVTDIKERVREQQSLDI